MLEFLVITGFVGLVLSSIFSTKKINFDNKKIDTSSVVNLDRKEKRKGDFKRFITKRINILLKQNNKKFKIGKSGTDKRIDNYKNVHKMFILAGSKKAKKIEELESYYNSKYIKSTRNSNKKEGTAGKMSDANGYYFLYLIFFE